MTLICPICGAKLNRQDHSAVCENGHCFDYAKSGYLNLAVNEKSADHGDNPAMVKARTAFLEGGYYQPLKEKLQFLSQSINPDITVDLGCGEGYYTSTLAGHEKYGIDLSKDALIHAAKHDHSTQYLLSSIFHLPIAEECCSLAVTCFAPAACEELQRILKPGGIFLFVTPGAHHLFELKQALYDTPYLNEEKKLDTTLVKLRSESVTASFEANQDQLMNLFQMTPYAYRTGSKGKEKLQQLDHLNLTEEFIISVYQKQ
ncbi:MAG: methyltransferase domain-containing protein [Solobacterium sp.]|jgi:23S rRNA (guanine745-N1)-methyltransferase|nr:methyltransferase domain-containing protein [Solobacterium sp.]